ncbi:MAG TPA: hypothetical protein VHY91_09365 [Pirellulales bacterium]|jgi:hypothetical protein|nr:hypothetical protein [Pirellulales bacterium]
MGTRLYNAIVVVFWMATMSWLLVDKLWPTLRVGDPPNYHSIIRRAEHAEEANAWAIYWNDHLAGWSLGKLVHRDTQMRELHSRLFIAELPLEQMVPHWLGGVIKPMLQRPGHLDMDMSGWLDIDPLDRVVGFNSSMRLAGIKDAVTVNGIVSGNHLRLIAKSGDLSRETDLPLTADALVGDGLSPQGYLPDLYQGQTWSVCNYSLFQPASNPIAIIEARVEKHEPIVWDGASVKCWVVVYRGDAGSEMASEPQAKVWVRDDGNDNGLVLQQELWLFGSKLQFTRLTPKRGQAVRDELKPYAKEEIPAETSRKLLRMIEG